MTIERHRSFVSMRDGAGRTHEAQRGHAGLGFQRLIGTGAIGFFVALFAGAQCGRLASPRGGAGAPGVYALMGSGGTVTRANGGRTANVAFVVGPGGVVVLDTGISYLVGEEIIAAVASVTAGSIRLAIVTHPNQEAI